jgi:GNAT superfamily N-acetyltransferase
MVRVDLINIDRARELADLMNRNCDLESNRFTADLIRARLWEYPSMSAGVRLGAFEGDRLIAAMVGGLQQENGFIHLFAVDGGHRGQGLADRMLIQLETELRSKGAQEVVALCGCIGYFMPGLDPRYTPAMCLLEKHGYTLREIVCNMLATLRSGQDFRTPAEQAEVRVSPCGIRIRRAEPHDQAQVRTWMHQHFPGGWEGEVDMTFSFRPIPLWLAFRNGAVAGFAAYDVNLFQGGFGPTGVEESLRGRGVGAALFLRTLADMQARGYSECEVGWLGPMRFYSRVCGARVNRAFWQMHKKLGAPPVGGGEERMKAEG